MPVPAVGGATGPVVAVGGGVAVGGFGVKVAVGGPMVAVLEAVDVGLGVFDGASVLVGPCVGTLVGVGLFSGVIRPVGAPPLVVPAAPPGFVQVNSNCEPLKSLGPPYLGLV